MRFQHFMLIFACIFLCTMIPTVFFSEISARSAIQNNEYSRYLVTATEDCIASVTEGDYNSYIFSTQKNREKAVDTFYNSLSRCFNYQYTTYESLVYDYVPCLFLIDTDGYYIQYGEKYNENGEIIIKQITTSINKWAESEREFTVEYHLDDTVCVTKIGSDGKPVTHQGYYYDVYEKFDKDANLTLLNKSLDEFRTHKSEIIIRDLQENLEYYVNNYQGFINRPESKYQFTLPRETGNNWARLIDNPTVISFLQGRHADINGSILNIYALAGSEIEINEKYYISKVNDISYYHIEQCNHINDVNIFKSYSMRQAAKHGAYPCPDCVR